MSQWRDLEDACRAWVKTVTGFSDDRVFWAEQRAERPASGAFATLKVLSCDPVGATDSVVPSAQAGALDVLLTARGVRDVSVSVQVYGGPTVAQPRTLTMPLAGPLGLDGPSAVALASALRASLALPSVRDALGDAGLSPYDRGAVRNLAALLGTAFDGRASLDVRFYWVEDATESTTSIQSVEVGGSPDGIIVAP